MRLGVDINCLQARAIAPNAQAIRFDDRIDTRFVQDLDHRFQCVAGRIAQEHVAARRRPPPWRKCPASIRSDMTECSTPDRLSTPSMVIVGVPAPETFAPILFSKSARSAISGSQAALLIEVMPWASTAASMVCSVAPTEGKGKEMSAALQTMDRGGFDIALLDQQVCAHRLKCFQMQIDWARADGATAWQGDGGVSHPLQAAVPRHNKLARIFRTCS